MSECIRRPHSYWTTCRCDNCAPDRNRKRKIHYVYGNQTRIPHDVAWAALAAKFQQGWSASAVASAVGVPKDYFSRHLAAWRRGQQTHLGPVIAAAIMRMGRPTEGQVGAEPTRRRLRALAAIGHSLLTIADETGINFSTLAMVRVRNTRVSAEIANGVADVYERLAMTPGHNHQALALARQKGWPPPLAWDDIDDIDEQPTGQQYDPTASRLEHLTDLIDQGAGITEACRQLGIKRESLERWCDNNNARHLYTTLCDRETPLVEYRNQHSRGAA